MYKKEDQQETKFDTQTAKNAIKIKSYYKSFKNKACNIA